MQSTRLASAILLLFAMPIPMMMGCNEEDSTSTPTSVETGSIEIDATPDVIAPPWSLTGPSGYSTGGNGDHSFSDLETGSYSVTWGGMAGWVAPAGDTQTLTADATVTFSGTYVVDPGPGAGFSRIPEGTFSMGAPGGEPGRGSDELQHTVTLATPFHLAALEVTNQQYAELAQWALGQGYCTATTGLSVNDALDGSTEVLFGLDDPDGIIAFDAGSFTVQAGFENHPVKNVTWFGAAAYCDWMSLQAGIPRAYDHGTWECNGADPYGALGYRLPTEAEWEYACRAGSLTAFTNGEITNTGCDDPVLDEIGWYCGNSNDLIQPVGQKNANSFGLFDMHGNAYEWCNDYYAPYGGDATDPVGGLNPNYRVARGGACRTSAAVCRSANRAGYRGDFRTDNYNISWLGIRPARSTQ